MLCKRAIEPRYGRWTLPAGFMENNETVAEAAAREAMEEANASCGPLTLFVHMVSIWVPFTSESKEAVAAYPEIVKEIRLALQEAGRRLGVFVRKRRREADELKKRSYIEKYIPTIGEALQEILGFSDRKRDKTVKNLQTILQRSRKL